MIYKKVKSKDDEPNPNIVGKMVVVYQIWQNQVIVDAWWYIKLFMETGGYPSFMSCWYSRVHRLLHQKEEPVDGWQRGEHCRDIYGPKAAGVDLFLLQKPTQPSNQT